MFLKHPEFQRFSSATQALILAKEIKYEAMMIQYETVKTKCKAIRVKSALVGKELETKVMWYIPQNQNKNEISHSTVVSGTAEASPAFLAFLPTSVLLLVSDSAVSAMSRSASICSLASDSL
jgi:hypothetical protein